MRERRRQHDDVPPGNPEGAPGTSPTTSSPRGKAAGDTPPSSGQIPVPLCSRCLGTRIIALFNGEQAECLACAPAQDGGGESGGADVERLAGRVHYAYLITAARLGWPVKPEMAIPYAELPEDAKELDRATVRTVLAFAGRLQSPMLPAVNTTSPMGCICPPTSEKTCENPACPRQNPFKRMLSATGAAPDPVEGKGEGR